ncbi:unnamed protein product [Rhizophagus irregularis]|nr:unnamed protein product [Rhizophagus irregularis]
MAQQPVVLIDNHNSTLRPASSSKHTNKKSKLPLGTGDIANTPLTLDVSPKNLQQQIDTANASCSTVQSGSSVSTDMEMDQPTDPASTSAQQRIIPIVSVDPIPILPNLVIATPADTVKGKSASDKKTYIRRFFSTNGVATASVCNVIGKSYVCAHFSAQSDVDDALKRDTALLINSQKEGVSAPTFTLFTTIKLDKTEDEKAAAKNCTIQVIDIPLYRKGADVCAAFSNFGNIVKLSLVTKGLPRNTNARDLVRYLKSINARSCFLPRNAKNYRTFNYAYDNFLTEEDMVKAAQTHHSYKGKPLYWTSPDAQCCNFCGNPDHLAKSFKGKNQSRPGNNNGNNRTPNPNLQNSTTSGGSMHDNQLVNSQLHQVRQMMTELQSMFKGLQAEVTALNRKVDDRIKNKSVSHSPVVQKPIPFVPAPIPLQTQNKLL